MPAQVVAITGCGGCVQAARGCATVLQSRHAEHEIEVRTSEGSYLHSISTWNGGMCDTVPTGNATGRRCCGLNRNTGLLFVFSGWGGHRVDARPWVACSKQAVRQDERPLVLMKGQQGREENDPSDLASGPAVPPPQPAHRAHARRSSLPAPISRHSEILPNARTAAAQLPVAPRATRGASRPDNSVREVQVALIGSPRKP